jgi:hypothetical protein
MRPGAGDVRHDEVPQALLPEWPPAVVRVVAETLSAIADRYRDWRQ